MVEGARVWTEGPWRVAPRLPESWTYEPGYEREMSSASPQASAPIAVSPRAASLFAISAAVTLRLGAPSIERWSVQWQPSARVPCVLEATLSRGAALLVLGVEVVPERAVLVRVGAGTRLVDLEDVVAAYDEALRAPLPALADAEPTLWDTTRAEANDRFAEQLGWPRLPGGWRYGDSVMGEIPEVSAARPWPADVVALATAFGGSHRLDLGAGGSAHVQALVSDPTSPRRLSAAVRFARHGLRSNVTIREAGSVARFAQHVDDLLEPLTRAHVAG